MTRLGRTQAFRTIQRCFAPLTFEWSFLIEEVSPLGLVNAGTNKNAGRRSCGRSDALIGPCLSQTKVKLPHFLQESITVAQEPRKKMCNNWRAICSRWAEESTLKSALGWWSTICLPSHQSFTIKRNFNRKFDLAEDVQRQHVCKLF